MKTRMYVNRRAFAVTAAAALGATAIRRGALAQDEIPTTGARRGGPIIAATSASSVRRGVAPLAIQIANAGVDAPIEKGDIVDGVMQDPSGPWIVAWYDDLAALGEGGNVVMAGHVDYWDTGPAIFYTLGDLAPGDKIAVTGSAGEVYTYAVEWGQMYTLAELISAAIQEIVGDTGRESLTLITCGGEFDPVAGEYLERLVVRAVRS